MDAFGRPYRSSTASIIPDLASVDSSSGPSSLPVYTRMTSQSLVPASSTTRSRSPKGRCAPSTSSHSSETTQEKPTVNTRPAPKSEEIRANQAQRCGRNGRTSSEDGEEWLSEKIPHRLDTQSHRSRIESSYINHERSSPTSIARSQYPPRLSHDNDGGLRCMPCLDSLPPKARLWLSFGAWIATSIGFLLAIAFWKTEVFTALDNLSHWLVEEGYTGYAYMFALIVLTTIPPLPLYSTLMMLAGYTWGTWTGFYLSYSSSLFGAVFVYFVSRHFFGQTLVSLLTHMPTFARTVRAVSRNPKLLFLVRLAPYPYNVMNVLLAACPGLRWRTYVGCTALSLLKVVVHTSIGSGIRSFKDFHAGDGAELELTEEEQRSREIARWSTIIGVILCLLILAYLGYVARKAVDGELEDEDLYDTQSDSLLPIYRRPNDTPLSPPYSARSARHGREASTAEERMAFLSPVGVDSDEEDGVEMSESRLNGGLALAARGRSAIGI